MENKAWAGTERELIASLNSSESGISGKQAAVLLSRFGPKTLSRRNKNSDILLFFSQFKSPITLMLLAAAMLSLGLGQQTDAFIILCILSAEALKPLFFSSFKINGKT
jgi:Mg2+-importing ATPase